MTTQTKAARAATPISVNTAYYQQAHGRMPRGTGAWAFEITKGEIFWATSTKTGSTVKYGEAKRIAIAEARKRGVSTVTVMS